MMWLTPSPRNCASTEPRISRQLRWGRVMPSPSTKSCERAKTNGRRAGFTASTDSVPVDLPMLHDSVWRCERVFNCVASIHCRSSNAAGKENSIRTGLVKSYDRWSTWQPIPHLQRRTYLARRFEMERSAGEQNQLEKPKISPDAKVVKHWTISALFDAPSRCTNGSHWGLRNDADAKAEVAVLLKDFGWPSRLRNISMSRHIRWNARCVVLAVALSATEYANWLGHKIRKINK